MPIEITFHASTAAEIRQQMLVFLNLPVPDTTSRGIAESVRRLLPRRARGLSRKPAQRKGTTRNRRHLHRSPSRSPWVPTDDGRRDKGRRIILDDPDISLTPTAEALANEKLKAETIATLQTLFSAGKVKVVSHVLDKYGNGAKSFPEIDASQFPLIADALKRGEAA